MKTYKDFEKMYIGYSDIASLTIRACGCVDMLNFGGDNRYYAYIVNEEIEMPKHYTKTHEFKNWIKIYDDEKLTFNVKAEKIEIYQSGSYGCIIKLLGNSQIIK